MSDEPVTAWWPYGPAGDRTDQTPVISPLLTLCGILYQIPDSGHVQGTRHGTGQELLYGEVLNYEEIRKLHLEPSCPGEGGE